MEGGSRGRGRGRLPPQQPVSPPRVIEESQTSSSPELAERMFRDVRVAGEEEVLTPAPVMPGKTRGRGAGRGTRPGGGRDEMQGAEPQLARQIAARYEEEPPSPKSDSSGSTMTPIQVEEVPGPPPVAVVEAAVHSGSVHSGTNGRGTAGRSETGGHATHASVEDRIEQEQSAIVKREGTKGEAVPLKTNYLKLSLKEGMQGLVEYHVSISPSIEKVKFRRMILDTPGCQAVIGTVRSFDGMVLHLPKILKNDVTVIETQLASKDGREAADFTVTVTYVKVKTMKESTIFLNVLLRRIMRMMDFEEMRRQFFDLNMAITKPKHKLTIWPGYAVCAENLEGGLLICVDGCSRILRQDTVYESLKLLKTDPQFKRKFEEFIIGKIVITKYNFKCYKVDGVSWEETPGSTFEYREKTVTFQEYLKAVHGVEIKILAQPMLISKLKPRRDEAAKGVGEKLAALVPELCYITGLTDEQRADFGVMTDLADATRLNPQKRVQNLEDFIKRLLANQAVAKLLDEWGLSIDRAIVKIPARRVDGPPLQFGPRQPMLKNAGPDFSRESTRGVSEPVDVKNYTLICTERDTDKAKRFMDSYKEVAGPLGIKILQNGTISTLKGFKPNDFVEALRKLDPSKVHFVVVLMPMQRDDVYSAIKRFCVHSVPIPSQCIVTKTLNNEKRLRSITQKICLQINCKLGGGIWSLKLPIKEDIMFIGIDAAHDPLKKEASVICLVASLNRECTKYFSVSKSSHIHQELSNSLHSMAVDALKEYRKVNNKYPDRIIVYRDGGSLGAMEAINLLEVNDIKKAISVLEIESVHFTFVVVCKRIAQRFFLQTRDKYDNPPPGVIVDNTVTRCQFYDFYVVSQLVRQGTVNPTHFVVVDQNDPITPDMIQRLSYMTCFMYFNWSGTVRVPAMVQYAHKMAALLSKHVKATPDSSIAKTLYYL